MLINLLDQALIMLDMIHICTLQTVGCKGEYQSGKVTLLKPYIQWKRLYTWTLLMVSTLQYTYTIHQIHMHSILIHNTLKLLRQAYIDAICSLKQYSHDIATEIIIEQFHPKHMDRFSSFRIVQWMPTLTSVMETKQAIQMGWNAKQVHKKAHQATLNNYKFTASVWDIQ